MRTVRTVIVGLLVVSCPGVGGVALAQPLDAAEQAQRFDEHVFGQRAGAPIIEFAHDPSQYPLIVKRGHVLQYDAARRIPLWVAYRVEPEWRDTPPRSGRFKTFRTEDDPAVTDPVSTTEYNGLFGDINIARGHMAPYAVMGGDRDGDSVSAELDSGQSDPFDETTVFHANTMTNIAPQYHDSFNGSPGIWYCLERWVQDCVVLESQFSVWVIAGPVVGPGQTWLVGSGDDIAIPHMFYKIVVLDDGATNPPLVFAFLLPHHRTAHGQIEDYLVSIDVIEGVSGLDFFSQLDDGVEDFFEDQDTYESWIELWDRINVFGACDPDDSAARWRPEREDVFNDSP